MVLPDENSRYSGPITIRFSYMAEFLVVCPKCQKDAIVTADYDAGFRCSGKLYCGNCHHTEDAYNQIRYMLLAKRNCADCGRPIAVTIPNVKEKAASLLITCTHCRAQYAIKPRYERYVCKHESVSAVNDPIFNLPLWLQHSLKNDVFWAYNRSHLADIKAYVQATLRERQTPRFPTTMVERLPNFIKAAKNRANILKIISQLEYKSVASY